MKYETLLKLFFGGAESKEVTIRNIEVFEKQIKDDLKMLRAYCESLEKHLDTQDHVCYYLTASFGVETYEAYLRWSAKAKRMLK